MNDCDICGRPTKTVYVVEIEGATMNLCSNCAKDKKPVRIIQKREESRSKLQGTGKAEELDIVPDYGRRIKSAREVMGLSAKVLAEKINEKESTLARVERQEMLPPETLMKKLEKELGIRLTEVGVSGSGGARGTGNAPITLGDAAIMKKDKK
jgi:putative transcription factor